MAGLYIHIPFCKSRCIYCDFFSTTFTERMDAYADALCKEISTRCEEHEFDTIYIGGGTPSWLGLERLERIFDIIRVGTGGHEITLECNPDDVTAGFVNGLKRLPVNRVSLGVQSLTDERLRIIGRRHTAQQAVDAVRRLQASGYHNISIDLIYGLPGQSMDEWRRDLATALSLDTPHLSAYSLMYEEGTPLWRLREEHRVTEAHEELSFAMYGHLIDTCAEAGLMQYELSNFAKQHFESQHNSAYWRCEAYIGIGAGAHSFDGAATRRQNIGDLEGYIRYWQGEHVGERCDKNLYTEECLTTNERFNERVFTGLRTRRGVDVQALKRDFPAQAASIKKIVQRQIMLNNLVIDNGFLRLTRQALFVSDDVMSELMIVED